MGTCLEWLSLSLASGAQEAGAQAGYTAVVPGVGSPQCWGSARVSLRLGRCLRPQPEGAGARALGGVNFPNSTQPPTGWLEL